MVASAHGLRFADRGEFNGYRRFRARLPGEDQYAWLGANRVRRAYVSGRDERPTGRAAALANQRVHRHPEHPDCGWFLEFEPDSEGGRKLLSRLDRLPFPARKVRLLGE